MKATEIQEIITKFKLTIDTDFPHTLSNFLTLNLEMGSLSTALWNGEPMERLESLAHPLVKPNLNDYVKLIKLVKKYGEDKPIPENILEDLEDLQVELHFRIQEINRLAVTKKVLKACIYSDISQGAQRKFQKDLHNNNKNANAVQMKIIDLKAQIAKLSDMLPKLFTYKIYFDDNDMIEVTAKGEKEAIILAQAERIEKYKCYSIKGVQVVSLAFKNVDN